MTESVDVAVVGAGAMGSAAAWALARRGRSVVVLEQFQPGHHRGSSHGPSRIFRFAYPDRDYIEFARRALTLWRELEEETSTTLLDLTGGVDHGDEGAVGNTADALAAAGADHEMLAPAAAAERWPAMRFEGTVCFSPDGGRIHAERAVQALQDGAAAAGADLRFESPVRSVRIDGDTVVLDGPDGLIRTRRAVVASGAWAASLLGKTCILPALRVTQEQVFHFAPRPVAGTGAEAGARAAAGAVDSAQPVWPSFIHHRPTPIYGLESTGVGIKVAEHHAGRLLHHPEQRSNIVDPAAQDRVEAYVREWLPGLDPAALEGTTCLYTSTPTEDFVIDRAGPLTVGAGFSGHGFKFTPAIGEMLADLATGPDGAPAALPRFRFRA